MNVLVDGGLIAEAGEGIECPGAEVWDAAGGLLSPGFTDLHAHLRQPGHEYKETIATGTAAAAAGGFTTVCAMPNLEPPADSLQNLEVELAAIRAGALVRVRPYGTVTEGQKGLALADISGMAPDVIGFSDDGCGVQNEDMMRTAMRQVAAAGRLVAVHSEVDALLPADGVTVQAGSGFAQRHGWQGVDDRSEWLEVERDLRLAQETGCRLHICHVSTAKSLALVRGAKARGVAVTCEVAPHHLLLSCDDISRDDGCFKMNPPLRGPKDVAAAVWALTDGTVDAIASDHAPHSPEEKAGGFAKSLNGVVGLETAFPTLYTGLVLQGTLPLERLLHLLTNGPRAVLGQAPRRLAAGQPADITVLNLETERAVDPAAFKSKGRATPFAGWRLRGWPVLTLYGGKIVFKE